MENGSAQEDDMRVRITLPRQHLFVLAAATSWVVGGMALWAIKEYQIGEATLAAIMKCPGKPRPVPSFVDDEYPLIYSCSYYEGKNLVYIVFREDYVGNGVAQIYKEPENHIEITSWQRWLNYLRWLDSLPKPKLPLNALEI